MTDCLPILGICGHSGAGKTTLLEAILPRLQQHGLLVAIIKHNVHGLVVDTPGKDSDRLFQAGADVLLRGPEEGFLRTHRRGDDDLIVTADRLCEQYDLVLIEGHKETPLPKIWLLSEGQSAPPEDARNVRAVLSREADRVGPTLALIQDLLSQCQLRAPFHAAVLVGGQSRRMGQPKHLLVTGGLTWIERTVQVLEQATREVVLLGEGELPASLANHVRLPDVPEARGPMAGLLAAMRWAPRANWLVTACDMPQLNADALSWLTEQRRSGAWAVLPRLPGENRPEPLLACYDFRCRAFIEQLAMRGDFALNRIAQHPKAISPEVPPGLAPAWANMNRPDDLDSLQNPGDQGRTIRS